MSPQSERSPRAERLGWHPVDPVSLVAGLVAVGVALAYLFDLSVGGDIVVPLLLVTAGVIGLLAALRRPEEPSST